MSTTKTMSDIRRGNPKKRFLWRRLLPGSYNAEEEENNDKTSNHEDNSSVVTEKLKTFYLKRSQETPRDFQIASPLMISPESSEEDEDSSESSNLSRMLPKTTSQLPVESPPKRQSSEETSRNEVNATATGVSEQQLMTCQMIPRPFLASIDSPLGLRQPLVHQSSTEADATTVTKNKHKPAMEKDAMDQSTNTNSEDGMDQSTTTRSDDIIEEVEAETFEKTRLVLSTAASVLLLMRFSVTDQALSSLTRDKGSSGSENKTIEGQKEQLTQEAPPVAKEVTPSSPPFQVSSSTTTQHVVSPDISEKPCIMRRVSLEDPLTPDCPNRLAMPEDPNELNSLHCFVRAHLLEVFSLPPQKDKPGRVGLRCVFCSHLPRKDRSGTTMCTFYPKSLQDLYRSVMTWQRIHFRSCKHVIPKMKEEYWKHKESDQTRGKTTYWVTSAMRLGLQDINNGRNGICFVRPTMKPASTRIA